jgi:hypothetical protein
MAQPRALRVGESLIADRRIQGFNLMRAKVPGILKNDIGNLEQRE